jgi:hypothetical protein
VALNRLRKSLGPLADGDPVLKRPDGGYALAAPARVVAPAPPGGLASLRAHLPLALTHGALELAVVTQLPLPLASFAVALARTGPPAAVAGDDSAC